MGPLDTQNTFIFPVLPTTLSYETKTWLIMSTNRKFRQIESSTSTMKPNSSYSRLLEVFIKLNQSRCLSIILSLPCTFMYFPLTCKSQCWPILNRTLITLQCRLNRGQMCWYAFSKGINAHFIAAFIFFYLRHVKNRHFQSTYISRIDKGCIFKKIIYKFSYLNLPVVSTAFVLGCHCVDSRFDEKVRQSTRGISRTATFSDFAMLSQLSL